MQVFYSSIQAFHDPISEIYHGKLAPYAEKATRTKAIIDALTRDANFIISEPTPFADTHILEVHTPEYIDYIDQRSKELTLKDTLYPSNFIMDTYTPIVSTTYQSARASVNTALSGAQAIIDGERSVYSLCRPPGHHADRNHSGGYCYFNNTAIAAQYLSSRGNVAILDIDFHHGNGTQNIFYERSDVLYVSLHADPSLAFPYSSGFEREVGIASGIGYTKNYPLDVATDDETYLKVLRLALDTIKRFAPKYLLVSAGFDTHQEDPIAGLKLTRGVYSKIAGSIRQLNAPTLIIQEGGYNIETLGALCQTFLKGFID